MPQHTRVLIANRGEIAVRIASAAAALGMESVAVYAEADSESLHIRKADANAMLPPGGGDPVADYLNIDAIVQLAVEYNCDCVHPGYGFLSENADFARACSNAGVTFIGPTAESLELFGDKVAARQLAQSLDIPVIPGSDSALKDAETAAAKASMIGYPVMLKATGGGGGRGMRRVDDADQMPDAFERCASEAAASFGNADVFIEKLIQRPRHIEVQILADSHGNCVHIHERDCSVQLRNQKVIEIAPAPKLDDTLRESLYRDALKLAESTGYINAGTVEFLVLPNSGDYFFIECNPRIQVEHTVTEVVSGIDLVEAQFHIAAGATLADIGLANQQQVGSPRGYAVQARVVANGAGTLTAYKEPSGAGIRVDAAGYVGYTPAPQFDPLLAKVIGSTSAASSYRAAVERTSRALADFHIAGLGTNLRQLIAVLAHPQVRDGDARTTLLTDNHELTHSTAPATAALQDTLTFLQRQATLAGASAVLSDGANIPVTAVAHEVSFDLTEGQRLIESGMAGSVVEVSIVAGDTVSAGDTLFVVSAMKMESQISAPCTGTISAVLPIAAGDTVAAGQALAVISPSTETGDHTQHYGDDSWEPTLNDIDTLRRLASQRLSIESTDPGVVRQRNRGKLTCRERIDLLLDPGSFREVGSVAGFASYDADGEISAFTPANSVGGHGRIDGRAAVVCADDFTSRGGHADGAIAAKSTYLDKLSIELKVASIRLLDGSSGGGSVATMVPEQKKDGDSTAKESSGAIAAGKPRVAGGGGSFLPGHLGSTMYAEQLSIVPVVNVLLGSVVGLGAAKAVLGHFSVMVKDISQLFVAGPPVVSHAMGYDITKEDLGGWHIHCRNGSVDNLAESEAEAMQMTRRFLSYLPNSVYEAPAILPADSNDPPDRREEALFTLVPRKRTMAFDMRKALELMADHDSFFEIGRWWGCDQITGFARFNGHTLGIIASDSQHINGGALTADGCDKLRRHLDLCDLFHVPVLNLIDNPGFAVGLEHEIAGTIRKGGEWMIAFAQVSIPIFTVIMRRSFGVAGNNFATPRAAPCAWYGPQQTPAVSRRKVALRPLTNASWQRPPIPPHCVPNLRRGSKVRVARWGR
jgi:acetyl/propionyl-CoA carboxylase alpha subunit/acetyl-CoA carboxylase carboxyltransferase component